MDGKEAVRRLRELLNEDERGVWMNSRTSYDVIFEAAKDVSERMKLLPSAQWIKTETDVRSYALDYNHGGMTLRDHDMRFYVRLHDSSSQKALYYRDMEEIDHNNYERTVDISQGTLSFPSNQFKDTSQDFSDWQTATGSTDGAAYKILVKQTNGSDRWAYLGHIKSGSTDVVNVYSTRTLTTAGWNGASEATASFYRITKTSSQDPQRFSIRIREDQYDQVTGTATAAGSATAGECTLTDSAGLFLTTDVVKPGDNIHNTTDGSTGIVTKVVDATQIKTALFGGTNNQWASSDAYVIQPMPRKEIVLDPIPKTAGDLVEVPMFRYPDPVYSDYGMYPFPQRVMDAIIYYAAWLYKYRDENPDFGDRFYMMYKRLSDQYKAKSVPDSKGRRLRVRLNGRRGTRGW